MRVTEDGFAGQGCSDESPSAVGLIAISLIADLRRRLSATCADVTVEATVATGEVRLDHHASTRSAFPLGGFAVAGRGIIASDAGDAWAPAKPCPDDTPIRALARVHRWKRMLDDSKYRSAGDLAEPEGVTRSFVYGLIRLTFLAPDIVEAIPSRACRRTGMVPEVLTQQKVRCLKTFPLAPICYLLREIKMAFARCKCHFLVP